MKNKIVLPNLLCKIASFIQNTALKLASIQRINFLDINEKKYVSLKL